MPANSLDHAYKEVLKLLKDTQTSYLIVGGLAVGVLGEPRLTQDIDLIATINGKNLSVFLKEAQRSGFQFNKSNVRKMIRRQGTFSISLQGVPIDIILASTKLEESAFQRRMTVKLFDEPAYFPTPEDLILLKVIPGRPKDLVDVESVVLRHKGKLDRAYLERWAQKISDEAEDMRIWNRVKKMLEK